MTLRIGYCYVECVEQALESIFQIHFSEQNAWIHVSDYARPVRQARYYLGTLGGAKSFLRGAQIF